MINDRLLLSAAIAAMFSAPVRGLLPGGKAIYVCNAEGSVHGDGRSPFTPVRTLAQAVAQLGGRTNRGDAIFVMPGHSENVDAADWLSDMGAASGFSIIGCGSGIFRPSLIWTTATSSILLDTAHVEIANMRLFLAGVHEAGTAVTVAAPITVSGNGCGIVNCDIRAGFDANQIVADGIIWTGDDCYFHGNKMFAETLAVPSNTLVTLTGADRFHAAGNWIKGPTDATTRGVIDSETTACTNILIENNYLCNILAASTIALSLTANDTGVARGNDFFVNSGILPITASELEWPRNYVTNGEGEAGALVGTASA